MSLVNDDLIIMLHIAEGVGLELKCENIVLTATLSGNKLETEPVESSVSTKFHNNLIWETNRNSIKRMKTENLPIKLECFGSNIRNGQEIRNLIGYILLPIRGIPIIPSKKIGFNKTHWHKLVGLNAEWKVKKPEILLYITITDKLIQDELVSFNPQAVESMESLIVEPTGTYEMLFTQQGIHIELLQDEGLLQVGDKETDCDIFIVKLMFKNAKNLEQMVNPENDMHQLFRFNYNLLGTPTHCSLVPKGNSIFTIQEKIAINFRTSLKSLNDYFKKVFYIPIEIYYNDAIVGTARFNFANLLNLDNLNDFLEAFSNNDNTLIQEGDFRINTLLDLPPLCSTPYIEYIFTLKYLSTTKVSNCEIILDKPQRAEYTDNQAGGDKNINVCQQHELPPFNNIVDDISNFHQLDLREIQSDSVVTSVRQTEIYNETAQKLPIKSSRSAHTFNQPSDKTDIEVLLDNKFSIKTTKDAPRTFSFNIILQAIKFNRRPEIGIWQISLHHQNADTAYTIANVELTEISSNLIEFKNLELQLFFSSNLDEIFNVVSSESCLLKINGPRGMNAFAELDNEILLVSTKEKRSGVILMENQSGEKCAMAHIFVYLDDLGINFNSQVKKHSMSNIPNANPYMDENLAYQIVEELEEWKLKQQENFLVELKRKEVNHLAMLSIEWQKKKSDLEERLTAKLEECTKLTETLEEANKEIRDKGIHQIEHERLVEQTRMETEHRFLRKIAELNEKCRRIEDDMVHQVKLEGLKYKELEITKISVEKERDRMQEDLKLLTGKYEEMKKTFLPRDQLTALFQDVKTLTERLEEVQKSKQFYKEQWAKIIREVHKMKTENLQKMEENLSHCRTSGIRDFLNCEKNEFLNEREELQKIKTVLNSSDEDDYCDSFYEFSGTNC